MFLRSWRLLTIVLTALSMGPVLGHLLELPAKMRYEGPLWLEVSQTLYGAFGAVGGLFEIGAVVASLVLVVLVRARRPAFAWTLAAAACMLLAHLAYWIWLAPVNATVAGLTQATLPENWMALRRQWESTHAARAVLESVALAALAISILVETPVSSPQRKPA